MKIAGMILEQYHGNVNLTDEYVYMMGDIGAFQSKLEASKAELNRSRLELEMLRSSGVPEVTMNPHISDSLIDASADMRAALVTTASALSYTSQNGSTKALRKLKLTPFKTADEKNSIRDIMYRWELEFEAAGQAISVAFITDKGMTASHPLYNWAMISIPFNGQRRSGAN